MSNYSDRVTEIRERGVYALAGDAECVGPDTLDSAGAAFLTSVRDAVLERLEDDHDTIARDGRPELERVMDDARHEIADAAPDVRTHTRWLEFTDLAAYLEEPESGAWPDNLTEAADVALYQIANRLVGVLIEELATALDDDAASDDEGDDAQG